MDIITGRTPTYELSHNTYELSHNTYSHLHPHRSDRSAAVLFYLTGFRSAFH